MSVRGRPKGKRGSSLSRSLSTRSTLKGGLAITKSNLPVRAVQVLVVGVALADVAGQAVHGQVHLAQAHGLGHPLLAVDAELGAGALLVLLDEAGALHEHAARAAGRVEDAAVEGLDDLDDELDDGGGGEELAALLALGSWRSCRGSTRRSCRRRRPRCPWGPSSRS